MMPFKVKEKTINRVIEIEVNKIVPNPHQPRKIFDDEITGLAESIKENGLLQPLTVRKIGEVYELIAGERRLRAVKTLEFDTVPCIVMDITERNSAVMALVENIQRKNLNFFEEAAALEKLIDFYGMTQEDAAFKLGKSQSTIANKLRLLKLSPKIRDRIAELGLTERHARALLKLNDEKKQNEVIDIVFTRRLNVDSTEKLIENIISKSQELESIHRRSGAFKDIRLFVNTINKAVEMMKAAGIDADSEKIQQDGYIEYVVRIPTK